MRKNKVLARLTHCRGRIAALGAVCLLLGPLEAAPDGMAIHVQGETAGARIEIPPPAVGSTKNSVFGRRFENGRMLSRQTATRAGEAWSGTWRWSGRMLPRKPQGLASFPPGASNLRHSQIQHLQPEQDQVAPHSAPAAAIHNAAVGADGGGPPGGDTERPDTATDSSPAEPAPASPGPVNPSTPHPSHTHEARSPWRQGKSVTAKPDEVVEIKSTGVAMTYDITEIRARAGDTLTIRYDNTESEMAHNIVVVKTERDITPVGVAALQAHRHEYIPKDKMDRIIAFSKLAYPGDTVEFSFVVPPPGIYPYICTYSAHFTMMQGRLVSLPPEPPEPDMEERTRTAEETEHGNRNH